MGKSWIVAKGVIAVLVDYILFTQAKVDVEPNPNEVQDAKWVSAEELKALFQDKSLKFTPWFKLVCETMLFEWWEAMGKGDLKQYADETQIRRM